MISLETCPVSECIGFCAPLRGYLLHQNPVFLPHPRTSIEEHTFPSWRWSEGCVLAHLIVPAAGHALWNCYTANAVDPCSSAACGDTEVPKLSSCCHMIQTQKISPNVRNPSY